MSSASNTILRKPAIWALTPVDFLRMRHLFWFSLALMLVANAYNLFAYPFSIDAEVNTFAPNPVEFVGSGRWAAFLLAKYLVPFAAIPVVPILLACVTISAAYVVTSWTWDEEIGWPHYLAAPIALCHPLLFQLFSFSVISYSVGIAILGLAIGYHLLARPTVLSFAASVALFVFAFGIYQPVILFPCAAFLVGAGHNLARRGLHRTLVLALVFGAAVILALLINQSITQLSYRAVGVTVPYTDSYYDFDYLRRYPLRALSDTLSFTWPVVSGWGGPFIAPCVAYAAMMLAASGLAIVALLARRAGELLLLVSILLIGGAVLFSVMPCVVSRGVLPYRVLLGTPIALAGVVFCAGHVPWRSARWVLTIFAVLSFLAFAQIGARLYYSNAIAWLNDRGLGQAILERMDVLDDLPTTRPIPIEFAGFHDWPKSDQIIDVGAGSTLGTSFFAWDEGNPGRILDFLKTLGRFDLALISPARRAAIRPLVDQMPAWPRAGSVRVVEGVVVVRFGPYSPWQNDTLFPAPSLPREGAVGR